MAETEEQDEMMTADTEEKDEKKRAEIRRSYRKLMGDIARTEESLVSQTEDNDELLGYLREGDELFSHVTGPEECLMDAQVVRNLSRICRQQVHQMSANINQFRCEEYAEKLRGSLNMHSSLDSKKWLQLGQQAKSMFRRSPSLNFMYGALSAVEPQAGEERLRERRGRQKTELRETEALTLQQTETEENITDRIVQRVFKRLVEIFRENEKKPVNYFEFVLHPTNFGKSVENMFHVSFLIKENKAGISICPDTKMPLIYPISAKQKAATEEVETVQVVMNWNVSKWKKLVNDLEITTPMIS